MGGVLSWNGSLPCTQKDLVWDFITVQIMPDTLNRLGSRSLGIIQTLTEK